jgi:chaperonin GroEL
MIMAKKILFNEEARTTIKRGIDKLADAVKISLGPRGRNVIIDRNSAPFVTNDGVTIARNVALEDEVENLGATLIREAASKTNDVAGDGTTTATVLAQALIREGFKNLAAGANSTALRRGLEAGVNSLVKELQKMAKVVDGKEDIENVASISANDKEIGRVIAEAMEKVGKDGAITVENSQGLIIESEVVEGTKIDKGWVSPHFINNPERSESVIENPFILLTDKKLVSVNEIVPLIEKFVQAGNRELLVIAEEIDGEVLATLAVNFIQKKLLALAVRAPGFGDNKKELLKDLAVLTGATVVSQDAGMTFDKVGLEVLGKAKRVVATRDSTIISGGAGKKEEIAERILQIKTQAKDTASDYEKTKLEERAGKLGGGVGIIKVGAPTEAEMKEKKYKVEDALNATKAAVEEGIVVGGGVALIRASQTVKLPDNLSQEEMVGVNILWKAIESPLFQIAENAGVDGAVVVNEIKERSGNFGYNGLTGKFEEDLMKSGVIDPVKVTRSALQNAVSIATMFLTSDVVIAQLPKKNKEESFE